MGESNGHLTMGDVEGQLDMDLLSTEVTVKDECMTVMYRLSGYCMQIHDFSLNQHNQKSTSAQIYASKGAAW